MNDDIWDFKTFQEEQKLPGALNFEFPWNVIQAIPGSCLFLIDYFLDCCVINFNIDKTSVVISNLHETTFGQNWVRSNLR